jgi:2'-5' RNA ligase
MSLRLFVAAWVGEAARVEAEEILERLRTVGADVKWVAPEQLHATIRFLGAVPEQGLERAVAAVKRAASGHAPFAWGLRRLGSFPERGAPRVVWAGADPGEAGLERLAADVDRALVADRLVSPESRPFRAHVTLGRTRSPRGAERLGSLFEELSFRSPPELLEEVSLVESRLTPRGPEYVVRARIPLSGESRSKDLVEHEGVTS